MNVKLMRLPERILRVKNVNILCWSVQIVGGNLEGRDLKPKDKKLFIVLGSAWDLNMVHNLVLVDNARKVLG